ncbi:39S ribosomal protein L47, mitochondrial [Selaginella moellendorffii]|uniref:39S ribosomal protein L47, mitochondrial n=1 Tax=Selaginella moellendorffii TaxID=88036 RepID=UPI000D1C8EEF|nr:39S ribosomal protein L47, mitochondrial [Selaginella moellendorffii]|eukprot:XP_024544510.1 39S ribosomal protein L47, mitochondrial [Selaginella moellendorffii]
MQALLVRVARTTTGQLWGNASRRSKFTLNHSESGGVDAFFEAGRGPDPKKGDYCGRSWRTEELRIKSWDDLHKLWYVLYIEKNMLLSQVLMLKSQNIKIAARDRIDKVECGALPGFPFRTDSFPLDFSR